MIYRPNNSSSTYVCVFIVTVCDEKHLPHFIHAAEQQWQLPLEAKGNIQVTHKSYRHLSWEKHSTMIPPDKSKANQTIEQANSRVVHWPEPGQLLVHPGNPSRAQPRGGRRGGRAQQGCSAFANHSARHPVLLPPICSSSKSVPEMGPEAGEIWAHEPQVGMHYNSNLKLGRIYSWGYFYWIWNLSPLPK